MSTSTEEIVQQEQQEYDAEHELKQEPGEEQDEQDNTPAKPTGRSLFDASLYETEPLSLPKVDGEGVDKISAKFNGHVRLDRGTEADVAIIKGCKLGQTVTFMVECEVGPPVPGMTTNRDGDLDSLGLSRTFTVKHVYKPAAEEL